MRYGILCGVAAAALGGACGPAVAQPAAGGETWTRVAADDEADYFYDLASVRRAGGMVRSRLRVVVAPERAGAMRSAIIGTEINCSEQTIAYLSFDVFGEGGQPLRSSPNGPPDIERIRPGSPEEKVYRELCPASLVRPIETPQLPAISVSPPPMRHPMPVAPPAPPPPPPPPPPPLPHPTGAVVRARPLVPLASIIAADDYPAAALRDEAQGRVRVSLEISRQGRVAGCTVLASSGNAVLDSTTCRIFAERARFAPARNARGRTVADTVTAAVVWQFPDDPPPPEETAQPAQEQS